MRPHRIIIYAKDISRITGKNLRQARRVMAGIRIKFKKEKKHAVTVFEFCDYIGLRLEDVRPFLL